MGAVIWRIIADITGRGQQIFLQWVPAHCGLPGNERADTLAKEASGLPQEGVTADVRILTKAVSRAATKEWQKGWPASFFKRIMRGRLPAPMIGDSRDSAITVHQMRAGHWGRSRQYLHRIGRLGAAMCAQCEKRHAR